MTMILIQLHRYNRKLLHESLCWGKKISRTIFVRVVFLVTFEVSFYLATWIANHYSFLRICFTLHVFEEQDLLT